MAEVTGDALRATSTKPCCDKMCGDLFIEGRYVGAVCPVHGKQPQYGVALLGGDTRTPPVLMDEVEATLEQLEPYLDAIVCYASTMGEHEPNRIAHDVRALLTRIKDAK